MSTSTTSVGRRAGTAETADPRAWRLLALVVITTVMLSLSGTMLNITVPPIAAHFHASAVESNWILLSYMLVNTSLLVVMGQLADRVDRRLMFCTGLAVFTLSSILLGFSVNVYMLMVLRGVQAVGGAILLANAAAIIASVFPASLLNRAMGFYLAGFSVTQMLGPSLGGFIATVADWRWIFWGNVPVGLVALVWGWRALRHLPPRQHARRPGVDLAGNVVVFIGLAGLLVALSSARTNGWTGGLVLAGIAVFIFLLPAFAVIELRAEHPAVDLRLFRNSDFSAAIVAAFITMMPRMSVMVLIGLYLQGARGDSAFEAAVKITPLAIALTLGSLLADRLTRWVDERRVALVSNVVTMTGLAVLMFAVRGSGSLAGVLVGLGVVGLGGGAFMTINSSLILRSVPRSRAGNVNGVRLMLQTAGGTIATAMALSMITFGLSPAKAQAFFAGDAERLDQTDLVSLVGGYQLALAVLLGLMVFALIAGVVSLKSEPSGQGDGSAWAGESPRWDGKTAAPPQAPALSKG